MIDDATPASPRARRPRRAWIGGAVALVVGAAVLYGLATPGKEASAACAASAATVAKLDPLIRGAVAALAPADPARPMPDIHFKADGDTPKTLADFRGQAVLVNLWATWCVPCRKEMPALDRLQATLGGPDFQVVAVNVDTTRLDKPRQFLAEVAATHLPFYADPTGAVLGTAKQDGPVLGLPTTFLVDKNGCAVATMAGPADWASDEAKRVVEAVRE
jgi:thiol-disulfide isomerase/thioredoxin